MTSTIATPTSEQGAAHRRVALRRLAGANNEGLVALAILLLWLVVGAAHSGFWSLVTVFNLVDGSFETLLFALGFLLVLLTGGIDVSFDAVGIFTGYSVALMASRGVFDGNFAVTIVLAVAIGLGLGAINAVAAGVLRLPALIVTLGTRGIFTGVMLTWIGSSVVPSMPGWLGNLNNWDLAYAQGSSGGAGLNWLIIPVGALCVLISLFLRCTMTGRSLYAIGGNEEAARRIGFSVTWGRAIAFLIAGALAGLAGIVHVGLIDAADPQDLVGSELVVIAAVVIGGASIFGGRGSVTGTILGVLLIQLINASLISLGIPSAWDNVAVGALILIVVSLQLLGRRSGRAQILGGLR